MLGAEHPDTLRSMNNLADLFLNRYSKRVGYRHPAHRLWVSYFGFLTAIVGIMVWGTELNKAIKV